MLQAGAVAGIGAGAEPVCSATELDARSHAILFLGARLKLHMLLTPIDAGRTVTPLLLSPFRLHMLGLWLLHAWYSSLSLFLSLPDTRRVSFRRKNKDAKKDAKEEAKAEKKPEVRPTRWGAVGCSVALSGR